jgi:cell division initiation protein
MLTPAKIKNHHFEAAGRNAYKADSVDRFIEEIVESYERMFRENGDMYKKISLLAEKLEEYKKDEDNIRNALLTAQRMAEQIQREAREKAENILAEVAAKEQAENARIEAQTNELMTKAAYQARALVEEAQKQAEQIVYDATHESKEAAITARDCMIKEEAALEMMKVEVTKFKKQILDAYNAQLALIEQLPEIACAMIEEEKAAQAAIVEAPVEEVVEEPVAEEITTPVYEGPVYEEPAETVVAPVYEEYEDISSDSEEYDDEPIAVDALQQMISDAEDTDAEDEIVVEYDDEEDEIFEEGADVVIPEIDEESEADLDEIVSFFSNDSEEDAEDNSDEADVPVSKKGGFKFRQADVEEYEDDDYIDELDDEDDDDADDDNDGGEDLASKFRNFFKK